MKRALITLLSLLLLIGTANAQSVGLVLSGGGAKGITHIGIIQALEENDIPIDYMVRRPPSLVRDARVAMSRSGSGKWGKAL